MPVAGRKPKPEDQRRNRNKPTHEWTIVPNVAYDGPDLPESRPDGRRWPEWTQRWWKAISSMPHAALWTEGDWEYAYQTALVAAAMHEAGPKELTSAASELRQREKVLGTTVDARRDLRIRYVDPAPESEPEQVTRIDDYRNL